MNKLNHVVARIFLGHIFLLAGITKIGAYAGTQAYMESVGLSGGLLPLVILLEIGGGLAVITGFQTRLVAYALGAFSLVSAVLFHTNFADQIQTIMFMKNVAIAGGFLLLANAGSGAYSIDRFVANRGTQLKESYS